MLAPEGEEEEFEFYLKFAKPLVLNLPDTNDRKKAATWIRYLKNDTTDLVLRGDYLKLLLFVLHRRKLFGPFATFPDESKPLEKFPPDINIQDVAKNFIEIDKKLLKATLEKGGYGEWPPYTVACSSDLTEYASSQVIPNFGVQAYLGISRDPLQYWDHAEKAIFPIGESIETLQPESSIIDTVSPNISCFGPPDESKPDVQDSPLRLPRISPRKPKNDTPSKELEDAGPKFPNKSSPSKEMDEFEMDARVPPTWGSNLVNVRELQSPIANKSLGYLDIEVSDQDMLDFFNDDIDLFDADLDEAVSYLQGDSLVSLERYRPTLPMSPARTPTPEYYSFFPNDPERDGESSPYPRNPLRRVNRSHICNCSPKAGRLSPDHDSPVQSAPQPSFKKRPLSPYKLFDSMEYITSDKDMLDYYNESLSIHDDDPAFHLLNDELSSSETSGSQVESPTKGSKVGSLAVAPPNSPVASKISSPYEESAEFKELEKETSHEVSSDKPGSQEKSSIENPKAENATEMISAHKALIEIKKIKNKIFGEVSPEIPDPQEKSPEGSPRDSLPINPTQTSPVASKMTTDNEELAEIRKLEEEIFGKPLTKSEYEKKMEELKKGSSPTKDIATAVQQILEENNQLSVSVSPTTENLGQEQINKSGKGLGGDSFIDPEKEDFRWLSDVSTGPGLPENEEQDSALWESFGWWTDDPDVIFEYFPPTPRARGTPKHDPYAECRERWCNVDRTPPIFSRDPAIREGMAAQRQYTIDEFGMESFEEPVWTSGEQYFKYKTESSPFFDPREIDRKTLDPSQFPKYESPKMTQQLTDFRGLPEEEEFFNYEINPDLIDVSFTEKDFKKMSKVEAAMEALRHGPIYMDLPSSEPEEGSWADDRFLEETPPLFMLYPPFLGTPPKYDPNPNINAIGLDDTTDSISKYIEEDLKVIHAKIPVTTPQRSQSPKRDKRQRSFLEESPPFVSNIDVEPDPYIPSPEPVIPYVVSAQKKVDWDTNIGTPVKLKKSDAVVIQSEADLMMKHIKRKQELKLIYEREFESPQKIPTPPAMPHLMDEPIPRRLPTALPAKKLPPSGWSWQTPTKYKRETYIPKRKVTPTGISPPRPVSEHISIYYESPPEEALSPSMAVSSLMFSPPEDFGQEPSPIRSPGGRPVTDALRELDEIDREMMYPTDFQKYDSPELYQSPLSPEKLSPERQDWRNKVEEHEREFTPKNFEIRRKRGRNCRIKGLRNEKLATLVETSPPERQRQALQDIIISDLEAEIAALEAELFSDTPPRAPRPRHPDDISPDYERRMWQESLKLHDRQPYEKDKTWRVCPSPVKRRGGPTYKYIKPKSYTPKLETIFSPVDASKTDREDTLRRMKYRAEREVADDMAQMKTEKIDRSKYMKMMNDFDNYFRQYKIKYDWKYMKPKHPVPTPLSPPEISLSPEPSLHIFDEPVPTGQPPALLPPSGWSWKTPPKHQMKAFIPKKKVTPTGISPPRRISQKLSMFFESPPEELLSPTMAVSPLMFSPPEDFGKEPSPIRSPGGRPMTTDFSPPDMLDMAMMYPSDFNEGLDEAQIEFYDSPPAVDSPSPESKAWRHRVQEDEISGFKNKNFVFRLPKSGRSHKVTRSRPPNLSPLKEKSPNIRPQREQRLPNISQADIETEIAALEAELFPDTSPRAPRSRGPDDISPDYERRMWQESLKLHDSQPYEKDKTWRVCPSPVKRRRGPSYKYVKPKSYTPKLETIFSPVDASKRDREDTLRRMKYRAEREVADDMAQMKAEKVDRSKYMKMMNDFDNYFRQYKIKYDWKYMKPKHPVPIPSSPPEVSLSPEPPMHIFDEPVPAGQPSALLPPSGWNWKTPPKHQIQEFIPKKKVTPTKISPPSRISQKLSIFFESPPEELLSPTMAVSSLMFSPPEDFGKEPSLIRSPGGRPITADFTPPDMLDMAMMYPSDFNEGLDEAQIEFYDSPPAVDSPSPESKAWRRRVQEHEILGFKNKNFAFRFPKSGRSHKVTRSRPPNLSPLRETSPNIRPQREQCSTNISQADIETEIAALEAELFPDTTPRVSRPRGPDDISPDYERRMWQESLKLHDRHPYEKDKTWRVCPSPVKRRGGPTYKYVKPKSYKPKLETIFSPVGASKRDREDTLRRMKYRAEREVADDMAQMKAEKVDRSKYMKMMNDFDNYFRQYKIKYDWKYMKPKHPVPIPSSPPEVPLSPEPPLHIFDEPVPTGQPSALLPPSGWSYKTPPHLKYREPTQHEIKTPIGISPPVQFKLPPPGSLFYESPPLISPEPVTPSPPRRCFSAPVLSYPTQWSYSPIRSPGGRPIGPEFASAADVLDVAHYYPEDYEQLREISPELYTSPEYIESDPTSVEEFLDEELAALEAEVFAEKSHPHREVLSPTRTPISQSSISPPTPQYMRRAWQQELLLRDNVPYWKKTFIRPKRRKFKYTQPELTSVEEKYYELSPPSPPLKPRPFQEFPRDGPLPHVSTPPENWTWETPSPLKRKGLYEESPPLMYSPELSSPDYSLITNMTEIPTKESISITRLKKLSNSSPLRSPGGRPVLQTFQERPLDMFEIAQVASENYYLLDAESPEIYDDRIPSPPAPPPRPFPPTAYHFQPRRIPRRQLPLDPNVLYASTPESARKRYEPLDERIRFEQTRPCRPIRPASPQLQSKTYYRETPIDSGMKPWKKRRKQIEQTARRKLEFEEDEKEFEREMIEELQTHLESASPRTAAAKDMLGESPPFDGYSLDEISMLGDLNYEPTEFNFYVDDDVPQYDVRPAFEGQPDVDLMDTSMIQSVEEIPYEEQDFRWMDYDARCPWSR